MSEDFKVELIIKALKDFGCTFTPDEKWDFMCEMPVCDYETENEIKRLIKIISMNVEEALLVLGFMPKLTAEIAEALLNSFIIES